MRKTSGLFGALVLLVALTVSLPATARSSRLRIVPGRGTAAPSFVTGISAEARSGLAPDVARAHLRSNASRYHIDSVGRSLRLLDVVRKNDTATVRFAQMYRGLPVFGAQYLVHLRVQADGLATESVNGHYFTNLSASVKAQVNRAVARRLALAHHRTVRVARVDYHGRTLIAQGRGVAAHHFTLWGESLRHTPVKQEVFVSSTTGRLVMSYNDIHTIGPVVGTGTRSAEPGTVPLNVFDTGTDFEMRDQARAMFALGGEITTHDAEGEDSTTVTPNNSNIVTSPTSSFSGEDTASGAVDAHYGAGVTYEFYKALGRESIDDNGMDIISLVNAADLGGEPLYNAFWNGEYMTYGNPDPSTMHPFSAGLDVVAHELTHGVTEFSGGLLYLNQSGAMNEAYSDYFGNAVENNVEGISMTSAEGGYIGEDLCKTPDAPFDCPLRDMNDGRTTEDFIGYLVDFDDGGVHLNSTVYSGTLWDIREQLGASTADALAYRLLTEFTTPLDTFIDGREGAVAAAQAMGLSASQQQTVSGAFDAKGIISGWDSAGGNDSTIVRENVAPLGFFFSPPQVSGNRYIIGDYADKLDLCCAPEQIFVGRLDGSGSAQKVGQDKDPNTFNDEAPDISGEQAVWMHIAIKGGALGVDVNGRKLGGSVQRIAKGPHFQFFPSVSGNLVAWEEEIGNNVDIYARRIGGKVKKIATGGALQIAPQVAGNWIAWYQPFQNKIGLKNFKTGKTRSIKPRDFVGPPALGRGHLAWYQDPDADPPVALKVMNLKTGKKKTLIKESSNRAPFFVGISFIPFISVNKANVAYADDFGYVADVDASQVGRDVMLVPLDGGGPKPVTCNRGDQAYPGLSAGKKTAFLDASQGRTDLMVRAKPAGPCP